MRPRRQRPPRRGHTATSGDAVEREALERRWFRRLNPYPEFGPLVVGRDLQGEPRHRWLAYRQAFAPELVRRFLQTPDVSKGCPTAPLLDPFAGTGTTVVEAAGAGRPALGMEALPALAFVAQVKCEQGSAPPLPPLPPASDPFDWQPLADILVEPVHRATLLCAVAAQHTTDGKPLRQAPPLGQTFARKFAEISDDLATPLMGMGRVMAGDARKLAGISAASVGAVLTSPPYLSRHDYTAITRPLEVVHAHWYGPNDRADLRTAQVRAHPRAYAQQWETELPAAAVEAVAVLRASGEPRLAGVVQSYFEDLAQVFRALARVLRPGAPCWCVVGGARLAHVYIPTDLILAELAPVCGLETEQVLVARNLIPGGRKLGNLPSVTPRESILVLKRTG